MKLIKVTLLFLIMIYSLQVHAEDYNIRPFPDNFPEMIDKFNILSEKLSSFNQVDKGDYRISQNLNFLGFLLTNSNNILLFLVIDKNTDLLMVSITLKGSRFSSQDVLAFQKAIEQVLAIYAHSYNAGLNELAIITQDTIKNINRMEPKIFIIEPLHLKIYINNSKNLICDISYLL